MSTTIDYDPATPLDNSLTTQVIVDEQICVEVIKAGTVVGGEGGSLKNHWRWNVTVPDISGSRGQIVFGFEVADTASVDSNDAQYAGSTGGKSDGSTEDPSVSGVLQFKCRPHMRKSQKSLFTCSFPLKPGTTFGQLVDSITGRDMHNFKFRVIQGAFMGCRDGMCVVS